MDLHWQPVGPLPAQTYWRRRVVVLLALVAVLLVAALPLLTGGDEPDRLATDAAPSASPDPSPSPTPSAVPEPCPDGALEVVADSDAESYRVGARAALTLTVRNTGAVACRRELGQGAVELVVTSGEDRIWSSDDCAPGGPPGEILLEPDAVETARASWQTVRSAPGCPADQPQVQPGTYRVTARVGELRVPGAVFTVEP